MRVARSSGSTPEKQQDRRRWHLRPCIMTARSASWIVAALRSSLLALRSSLLAFGTERSSPRMNSSFVAQELRQRRNRGGLMYTESRAECACAGFAYCIASSHAQARQRVVLLRGRAAPRAAHFVGRASVSVCKQSAGTPLPYNPHTAPARLTLSRPQDIHTKPVLPITLTRRTRARASRLVRCLQAPSRRGEPTDECSRPTTEVARASSDDI